MQDDRTYLLKIIKTHAITKTQFKTQLLRDFYLIGTERIHKAT